MEDCRFETSELQASLMMSTPLFTDSWSLCNAANCDGSIKIQDIARITYVAIPAVPMIQLGDLVSLKVAGDGLFPGLASEEPPLMVDAAILNLFRQLKVCFLFLLLSIYQYFTFFINFKTIGFQLIRWHRIHNTVNASFFFFCVCNKYNKCYCDIFYHKGKKLT